MKRSALIMALVLLSPAFAQAAADRNTALVNSFRALCALEPPVFGDIERRAAALGLRVRQDDGHSQNSGTFTHSKSWLVPLSSGPYELIATEANGQRGFVSACGISAPDPNGENFKQALVSEMKLGKPSLETKSPGGNMRMTLWTNILGNGAVRLVDGTPKPAPGVMLFYEVMGPPKP